MLKGAVKQGNFAKFPHGHYIAVECVCSCDQWPYWLFETKGRFCIKIEFNSQKTGLLLQHGRCDVKWTHSIHKNETKWYTVWLKPYSCSLLIEQSQYIWQWCMMYDTVDVWGWMEIFLAIIFFPVTFLTNTLSFCPTSWMNKLLLDVMCMWCKMSKRCNDFVAETIAIINCKNTSDNVHYFRVLTL